jgi:hypothetical protein
LEASSGKKLVRLHLNEKVERSGGSKANPRQKWGTLSKKMIKATKDWRCG